MSSKRHVLVDPTSGPPPKNIKSKNISTNWTLCLFCQENNPPLQCPANCKSGSPSNSYELLANQIIEFQKLGKLPIDLDISRLDEGDGIAATMVKRRACFHKACRLKFNQTKLDRLKQQLQEGACAEAESSSRPKTTRSSLGNVDLKESICFICDNPAGSTGLHEASTYEIDSRVRRCAQLLERHDLLTKLANGDMIALEAKYHRLCLVNLYNQARDVASGGLKQETVNLHGIAFAELVSYMEELRMDERIAPVFKLVDLAHMYKTRLDQLGVSTDERIHSTRLKIRLLLMFPDLKEFHKGRDVLLTFDSDVGDALMKACDQDSDAMHLARAAQIVRREIFSKKFSFNGSFHQGSQVNAVPSSLLALMNMLLEGPSIEYQTDIANAPFRTAALSLSQLVMFNSVKHSRGTAASGTVRHSRDRETPLPLYIALKVHGVTRNKGLVDMLYHMGMCISYDRLLSLSTNIANSVCQRFRMEGVVCPPKMRSGLFTVAAVDNIDHNPSAATSKDSFHGTGISIMQQPSHDNPGTDRGVLAINDSSTSTKLIAALPSRYKEVPPAALKMKEFTVPTVKGPVRPSNLDAFENAVDTESNWLDTAMTAIGNDQFKPSHWISWGAYHANLQDYQTPPPAVINAMLPLFLENAHSVATIKHSMEIVKSVVEHVNPNQTPVITADQPLYTLAKQIQWSWPSTLGEDCFVVMFGGLHIEMAILKTLGDWLADSGWTSALVQADIASSGTADSFIKASHVTKTRHAHQVTAAALHTLMHKAYNQYVANSTTADADVMSFDDWCTNRKRQSVHFEYWHKTLSLITILLLFVKSLREGNFNLYIQSLTKIIPWFFALDHTHYSRWLPVHVRDMMSLADTHPQILAEFQSGNFAVSKTSNKFSRIAIDQCHEQNNAIVKGCGGAVGLTDNPSALQRWMVAGPEISRIVTEFETSTREPGSHTDNRHHEQYDNVQRTFYTDVRSLCNVIQEMGNPFLEESEELLVLDTRDIMDARVAETVRKIETIGEENYSKFVEERLATSTKPITDTIPKNKLPLFSTPLHKTQSKEKMTLAGLKNDCNLFSRLYVACQTRDGNLDEFFSHENQGTPPSLSQNGTLRLGTKADLLGCLEVETTQPATTPVVNVKVFDGAAVVQMLKPGTSKTFQDYADTVFAPYILSQLETVDRVDIVWDVYIQDSLKGSTRHKRGKGVRRRVAPNTTIPKNWADFLRVDENKTELFSFLSKQVAKLELDDKVIYATDGVGVCCSSTNCDLSGIAPCSHEEADTRMILHVADAVKQGFRKVHVRTVDTDVVVLLIATFNQIKPDELWIGFGTGRNFKYLSVHDITRNIHPMKCITLPFFHAFTGCDTVSAFGGRGKKTAWKTWEVFPNATHAFQDLLQMPKDISSSTLSIIERFVVVLYDRTSEAVGVNDARKQLFTRKARSMEHIPPTKAALEQHIKRACYQANCWQQALTREPDLPNPADWGWKKDDCGWQPIWTVLPEASKSCYELIHCWCKTKVCKSCKCVASDLNCTALCACNGECDWRSNQRT